MVGELIGEGEARLRGLVGDTPDLAMRLQALTEPGTVVVSAATLRLLGKTFETRPLPPTRSRDRTSKVTTGRTLMRYQSAIGTLALVAALGMSVAGAKAFDDRGYPDWTGSWHGIGGGSFDPSKPKGLGQQTPLKPEFQTILEASLADIAAGGQGNDPGYRCGSHGTDDC